VVGSNILFSFPMRTIALLFRRPMAGPRRHRQKPLGRSRRAFPASDHAFNRLGARAAIPAGERDAASFATERRDAGDAPALVVGSVFKTAPSDPVAIDVCGDTGFSE
jgi:hypothetical protein